MSGIAIRTGLPADLPALVELYDHHVRTTAFTLLPEGARRGLGREFGHYHDVAGYERAMGS